MWSDDIYYWNEYNLFGELIITRIMSKPDRREIFIIKSINIEFYRHSEIKSCLRDP